MCRWLRTFTLTIGWRSKRSIRQGADKIRINPGNIGDAARVREVVQAAKEREIPIRVGVNSGSLEKPILTKIRRRDRRGFGRVPYTI